ncbi:MAG TPA: class I SAM-dependent methyltransferase [Candidatus Acidoferrales bacterium]|nr:class I SAM-dependent methyltransferase [Candidatus Acidoferrales bacterium]
MSLQAKYDVWHQKVFESDPKHEDASSPWYGLVREQIGPVRGLSILEVACGRGGFLRELNRAGAKVTGCDFSGTALQVAAEKLKNEEGGCLRRLVQGDAQKLPFRDESFDVVVSCETIEHVPDARAATAEMFRVTREGGRLLLTTPNYFNLMGAYELYARIRHPNRKDDQPYDRRQWFPQIRSFVQRAGWKIVRTDGTVHQFPFVPGRSPIQLRAIERNRTVRRTISPFALHYFVVAHKNAGSTICR